MQADCLNYTEKEIEHIFEYYLGTPRIYKYCYENSPEFKEFVDNADDDVKKAIKKMHLANYGKCCSESVFHLATCGLSFAAKKIAEKKEFAKLEQTIKTEEFKTLFSNFYEITLRAQKKL